MSKISDAAVEAACKVIFGDYRRKSLYRRECEQEMRIALEAALPHLQPSPAGQGDALPPLPEPRVIGAGRHPPVNLHRGYTAEQMLDYARAALAARQADESPQAVEVCAEVYQIIAILLQQVGQFDSPRGQKVLDNLSQHRLVHTDLLPWEASKPVGQEPYGWVLHMPCHAVFCPAKDRDVMEDACKSEFVTCVEVYAAPTALAFPKCVICGKFDVFAAGDVCAPCAYQQPAQAVDLATLKAVSDEYNEWILFHAAGNGDYDDFLRGRAMIDSSKAVQS